MNPTYSPNHRVIFKDLKTGQVKIDASNDIVSIATNKAYGRCAGAWQMVLTYREIDGERYDQLINPNDQVTIELDKGDGKGLQPVMLGVVDRPAQTFNAGGNNPQRCVKISGRDLGKYLMTEIGWDISGAQVQTVQQQGTDGGVESLEANYLARVSLQAGTAQNLIEQLMAIFKKNVTALAAGKISFNATTDDQWEIWDSSLQYIKGTTLWAAMERYAHKPWNMLHADTAGLDSFQVTLERNPIDDQGMLARPAAATHEIGDEDIIMEDIGRCDLERVNLLCYWPAMYKVTGTSSVDIVMANTDLTKFDEEEIGLHGYCPQIIEDNFTPKNVKTANDQDGYGILVGEAIPRAEAFWNWYSMNHELESGTFQIHGDPAIKAGDVLLVRQGTTGVKKEYLIEQIGHTYQVTPAIVSTTTLHVTRGQVRA